MEYPNHLGRLMEKLTAAEFLELLLKKLEEINIENEEEITLLDKVLYKVSSMSKDYKFRLLTPQLQEEFMQRMERLKLEQANFLNKLISYKHENGPYTRPKPDVKSNLAGTPIKEIPDNTQTAFSTMPESNPEFAKHQPSISSSGSEERRSSAGKRKEDNSRFSAQEQLNEKTGKLPAKYFLNITKPEGSSRIVQAQGLDRNWRNSRSSRSEAHGRSSSSEDDFF